MINISGIPLSNSQFSVLSKGLSFVPTNPTKEFQTKVDLFKFYRSLQLKVWHYINRSQTAAHYQETQFRPKLTFMPCINNSTLNTFSTKVTYEVNQLFTQDKKKQQNHNLSEEEKKALKWLSTKENIVIKRADQGGAVVV